MTASDREVGQGAEAAAHRGIPVDVLREFCFQQVERSSLMQVAARAGMSRTSLAKFLAGAKPQRRTQRTLALYYLAARDIVPREEALAVLSDGETSLEQALLKAMVDHHQRHGRTVPNWVELLQRGR
jgi:hypothetical protein